MHAPIRPARARPQGFTLLEVLVVLVIVSITAGFVVMSIGNRTSDGRLQTEAERIHQLMALASQTAVINNRQVGFIADASGYRFVELDDHGWLSFGDDQPLRPRSLPAPLRLTLSARDIRLPAEDKSSTGHSKRRTTPQVLFLSSGETTPFTLVVKADDVRDYYRIRGNLTGQIEMQHVTGTPP